MHGSRVLCGVNVFKEKIAHAYAVTSPCSSVRTSIFPPRISLLSACVPFLVQILQEERVLRKVDVGEYPLDLVPLDKDVLSLELDGLFRRVSKAKRNTWS